MKDQETNNQEGMNEEGFCKLRTDLTIIDDKLNYYQFCNLRNELLNCDKMDECESLLLNDFSYFVSSKTMPITFLEGVKIEITYFKGGKSKREAKTIKIDCDEEAKIYSFKQEDFDISSSEQFFLYQQLIKTENEKMSPFWKELEISDSNDRLHFLSDNKTNGAIYCTPFRNHDLYFYDNTDYYHVNSYEFKDLSLMMDHILRWSTQNKKAKGDITFITDSKHIYDIMKDECEKISQAAKVVLVTQESHRKSIKYKRYTKDFDSTVKDWIQNVFNKLDNIEINYENECKVKSVYEIEIDRCKNSVFDNFENIIDKENKETKTIWDDTYSDDNKIEESKKVLEYKLKELKKAKTILQRELKNRGVNNLFSLIKEERVDDDEEFAMQQISYIICYDIISSIRCLMELQKFESQKEERIFKDKQLLKYFNIQGGKGLDIVRTGEECKTEKRKAKRGKTQAESYIAPGGVDFEELLNALIDAGCIDKKKTTVMELEAIFSGKRVTKRVNWTGRANMLAAFIDGMTKKGVKPNNGKWQVAAKCFTIENEEIKPDNLKANKKIDDKGSRHLNDILYPFKK